MHVLYVIDREWYYGYRIANAVAGVMPWNLQVGWCGAYSGLKSQL